MTHMKTFQHKKLLLLATLVVFLFTVSCKNKSALNESNSDSIQTVNEQTADLREEAMSETKFYLTADSLQQIKIGMPVNDIPGFIDGLYEEKTYGESPDAVALVFHHNGKESFITYDFGEGNIDVIDLLDGNVRIATPMGDLGIGDGFLKVVKLPGVEPEWVEIENSGSWYWVWNGLWFSPALDTVNERLSRKLFNPDDTPEITDFDNSVTIGFAGTGLPF